MISLFSVIYIIVIHYIADFVWQNEWMAINKGKSLKALLVHTVTYSSIWLIVGQPLFSDVPNLFMFVLVTFICHTLTDYLTSKWTGYLFKKKKYYTPIPSFGAFSIIGLDQVLHYVQLFLTYWYLIQG